MTVKWRQISETWNRGETWWYGTFYGISVPKFYADAIHAYVYQNGVVIVDSTSTGSHPWGAYPSEVKEQVLEQIRPVVQGVVSGRNSNPPRECAPPDPDAYALGKWATAPDSPEAAAEAAEAARRLAEKRWGREKRLQAKLLR